MSELKHNLTLTMKDNISAMASKANASMGRFLSSSASGLKRFSQVLPYVSTGLDSLGNKYTALLTGGAMFGAVKSVAALETRLTRLGIQSGKSAQEVKNLNNNVFEISQDRQLNVDASQLLDAVDKIVEKTGNLELAQDNLKNIAAMMSAAGVSGADAGALIADMFEKFNIKTPEDMLKTLDLLTNQGKAGAFTLQYMATQGERVTSAYARLGRNGADGVAEMGAMLQMIKKGVGSPEQAATALETYVRTLKDANKQKELMKAGIKLMDPNDPKRMRSGAEIMKDIITTAKGNDTIISKVFDGESMRAFAAVVKEYKDTSSFESLDGFLTVSSDGKTLLSDSSKMAATFDGAVTSLKTAVNKFSADVLAEPIQSLADALNKIDPEQMKSILKTVAYGVGGIGTLVAGKKLFDIGSSVVGLFKGKGLSGAAGALSGVQPVYVTNFGDMGGLGSGSLGGIAKTAGKTGNLLGKVAVPLMVASSAYEFATANDNAGRGSAVGSLGGTLGGAKLGAVIGTMIAPGIGTAIGGALGGGIGYLAGSTFGKKIGSLFDQPEAGRKTPSQRSDDSVSGNVIRLVFDNAPKGLTLNDNPFSFIDIKINTGLMEEG